MADEAGDLSEAMLGDGAPKDADMAAEDRKSLILSLLTMAISIPALIGA